MDDQPRAESAESTSAGPVSPDGELRRGYDTQRVLNALLQLSLKSIPLPEILETALRHILSIPWLAFKGQGCIFLVGEEPGVLIMKARDGISPKVQAVCSRVRFGTCLCGRAALRRKVEFADAVDDRHDVRLDGTAPHGHYCVPIMYSDTVLGLINIYIGHGHRRAQYEEDFLVAVADTLAGVIVRKRAEEELQKSRHRFQRIAAAIADYIYSVRVDNGQAVDTAYEPGCVAVTGYGPEEFRADPNLWIQMVPEEDRHIVRRQIEDIFSGRNPPAIEHRLIRKDGRVRWVKNTPVLYFDGQKRLAGYEGVVSDVTTIKEYEQDIIVEKERATRNEKEALVALSELKRIQAANISMLASVVRAKERLEKQAEELVRARKKAEDALAVKDEFTSTVSHELRTPLAISKEALSLLLRGKVGELSAKQMEIMTMASANIDRLAGLINDILDVSKIEAGKMELHQESFDAVQVVRESCDGWRLKANPKAIDLRLNAPDQAVMLFADKAKFLQILSNLMSNAIKFTPEEGRVEMSVAEDGEDCRIAVSDTGPGISPADMPKLFGKFKQLKRAYGPGLQGTGLGLSIVKSLVELHGGRISVESEVGKGTTFTVALPRGEN